MAKETKMGFEGKLYYGAAGATAATLIERVRDVTIGLTPTKANTEARGDGSGPVVESQRVVSIAASIQFTMVHNTADTALSALLAAAAAGTPIALRGKDHVAGKGPDFDYILEVSNGQPVKGEQTYEFTASPTDEAGREPVLANLYC